MNNIQNAQTTLKKAEPAKKKRKKLVSLDSKKALSGWLFILPFVLGLLIIYLPIIKESIVISFSEKQGAGFNFKFGTLQNYKDAFFKDTEFVKTLTTGIKQLVLDIPAIVIFSLFMAVLLNQKMIGRAAFRAILFVPVILSTGLIGSIDVQNSAFEEYVDESAGISTGQTTQSANDIISAADLSILFSTMKVGAGLVEYITQLVNDVYDIVNRSGVQILIFLAGLQSISPAIYESCSIDGATSWETFWKITFPMISPMILVNTVYTVIDAFTSADNTVMRYISQIYTQDMVLSSAMAWIYFVIVIAMVGIVAAILKAYTFYQRKD